MSDVPVQFVIIQNPFCCTPLQSSEHDAKFIGRVDCIEAMTVIINPTNNNTRKKMVFGSTHRYVLRTGAPRNDGFFLEKLFDDFFFAIRIIYLL